MFNKSKVIVLIPAAGSGTRMDSTKNKLLMKIGNDSIMDLTLSKFQDHEWVDSIIVVTDDEELKSISYAYPKTAQIVSGGNSRQESIQNGMGCIEEDSLVVIHDAARPFITGEIISKAIEEADIHGAAIVAVKTIDTIKKAKANKVVETLNRSELMNIQTPQVFRYELLKRAYEQEFLKTVTDDASLIEMMNEEVYIVEGSYDNIKITTQADINYANFISKGDKSMDYRVGIGYDVHQFTEGHRKDYEGRRILPGLHESHIHVGELGQQLTCLDLHGCSSIDDLKAKLKDWCKSHPDSSWILGRNWEQDVLGRYPTREDLDAVCPDRPVFLWRVCIHIAVVNTKALAIAGGAIILIV